MGATNTKKRGIEITWEAGDDGNPSIVAYLCYDTTLQNQSKSKLDLVVGGTRVEYRMRLPYTLAALKNRFEAGRDIPEWVSIQKPKTKRKGK